MKNLNKYIKGQMDDSEMDSFTEKLITEKFNQENKEKWANILAEKYKVERRASPRSKRSLRPLFMWAGSAAATVALLIAAFFLWQPSPTALADDYLAEYKYQHPGFRKGLTAVEDLRQEAVQAYKDNRYEKAIIAWEQIIQQASSDIQDRFYLGMSYLYHAQPDQAITNLLEARSLITSDDQRFQEEINWFLSLAYVKNEMPERALEELRAIKAMEWNYELAQGLIKKLE